MQSLMEKIFTRFREYPMNSMTPALSTNVDGKEVVSMLILGDDYMVQDFKQDTEGRVDIKISCYTERNQHNIGKDLVVRIDFYYPTGHPIFETVLYGDLAKGQKEFIEALKTVDKVVVWVADKDREAIKVMQLEWDYKAHADILDKLLEDSKPSEPMSVCPKCGKTYPDSLGALSRKDNATFICNDCGMQEAIDELYGGK